jgi:hypothetical protein
MSLPPPHATSEPPRSSTTPPGRTVVTVIVVVVALVAGLAIGALAFGGDDAADSPEGAAADAAAGCQLLRGLPDSIPDQRDDDDDFWTLDGPGLWRLQGASGAFSAAATDGGEYRALADDGEVLYRAVQQFAIDDANDALDDLRDWCADHDLD